MRRTQFIVVLVTVRDKKEAKKISLFLLRQHLAACINITEVNSLYWWQRRIQKDKEVLLLIKTRDSLFSKLKKVILSLHSYEVPEIISLPILKGHKDYLAWIKSST